LSNPLTIFAALEAIIGLLIEISFIATFTQRFFARWHGGRACARSGVRRQETTALLTLLTREPVMQFESVSWSAHLRRRLNSTSGHCVTERVDECYNGAHRWASRRVHS
jgi:hypothetical protein